MSGDNINLKFGHWSPPLLGALCSSAKKPSRVKNRFPILLGLTSGVGFGVWNLVGTWMNPLSDDSPVALLEFYGPMFTIWACASFVAARRSSRIWEGVKIGTTVAFVTFLVFDLAVIVRVNLFLEALQQRADWQDIMARFQASGSKSLRAFVTYSYLAGAPFKILVASLIGAIMGFVGGFFGSLSCRSSDVQKA